MLKPASGGESQAEVTVQAKKPEKPEGISQITTAARAVASAALIPSENPTTIPEKVHGVEILAAAGLPTPKHRLYLDASFFNNPSAEKVANGIERLEEFRKKIGPRKMIFRSAHWRESEFSGGAFHSEMVDSAVLAQYGMQGVKNIRGGIIKVSDQKNSPRVRRDINLRGIKGFDIDDMGIYLNEAVPSIMQITAVPLDNGQISLRYFNDDSLKVENVDPNKNTRKGIDVIIRGEFGDPMLILVDRQALIEDIKKAQGCFETPQEFEIHITRKGETDKGEWVFVQSKAVTPETTTNDTIPEDFYGKGAKSYHPNHQTGHKYNVIRANTRDVMRQTTAIVIDEAKWIEQWVRENMPGEDKFGKYYPYNRDRLPQGAYSTEGLAENSHLVYEFLRNEPECLQAIINKYLELIELATSVEAVTVMQKTTRANRRGNQYDNWDDKEDPVNEIEKMRATLVSLASVVFQGATEGDNEISAYTDHHRALGAGNDSQVIIQYELAESIRSQTGDNWENIKRLKNLKDGDPLTVMIKDDEASLYVPEP